MRGVEILKFLLLHVLIYNSDFSDVKNEISLKFARFIIDIAFI